MCLDFSAATDHCCAPLPPASANRGPAVAVEMHAVLGTLVSKDPTALDMGRRHSKAIEFALHLMLRTAPSAAFQSNRVISAFDARHRYADDDTSRMAAYCSGRSALHARTQDAAAQPILVRPADTKGYDP